MAPISTLVLWILLISQVGTGFSKKGAKLGESCDRGDCVGEYVFCNRTTRKCQCEANHPFQVNTDKGTICAKAAKLGEGCLKAEMCLSLDENSDCIQEGFTPTCQCKSDYHQIYDKTQSKDRCVLKAQMISSDLLTLLIVGTAMTGFCGLTCLVLRIFARARFGPRRNGHYANAQAPPAVTLSAEQGDHLAEPRSLSHSRNSSQRSSLAEIRRQSGSLLAPPTRPDSRRASNTSIRSSSSSRSQRSYSLKNPAGHQNYQHNQQLHPSLQHRPSDPESRSQLSLGGGGGGGRDSVSGGSGSANSVTFNLPLPSSSSAASTSHSPTTKGKRSGSAGTLPV
ncbi:uncharacterized protein LOC118433591 [Folsomia candida]|uniref:uncharacterized protein LOC118433591 n=1 Tax=Folsomia candida TaxID=158441 RepID=UPI001604CCB7|nr:uncharacterized protein LOC118433591 [Folsomia candida]